MNVQWEDENLGESICNALKKEEVTYADIEGITGISIDSQYVVKLDWKDKTEQYVYNSGNDMCEILELQDFSTLADLKKFPYLRELYLNECIVDDNTALGELTKLENLKLDGYSIDSLDRLKNLTALKSLIIQGAEFEDLQALKELTNMEELMGFTDLRRGIDGLATIVCFQFKLDPYDKNTLFLFCGRRSDRIKALLWEGDGFLLMYKRLDNGAFRWPRSADEAMSITKDQYRMLMQGLEIVARYPIEELKETPSIT